ncbi:Major facilitator superfamily domain general substrate transporter [Penicillium antarcticum]|uniref:Major facilitator superfamily domain general substrate transporter n=1 Tax=Penicillium antarcticum TaxID=416450 RepID=UPI002399609E|nr:Major facilitator superfamily domain general substrate transporter [Penicillium antarcticum]KAJ5320613.1 Major facilitator superfamily domain general substrate transporter [Penicillium antarcticum]
MFVARFMLGFGIGLKSATVPMYGAISAAPSSIRSALVVQWQMWTAFGMMVGYAADLIFYNVDSSVIVGLNWRCIERTSAFMMAIHYARTATYC